MPAFSRCNTRLSITMLILFSAVPTCDSKENLSSRVDPLVQPYLDNDIVMGMTIGILQDGKATTLGYGQLSAKNPTKPDGDTLYEIGSISKVFTGLLLADAVTQGHVTLDQPAAELLPMGMKMPKHYSRPITLQDLATHVSGLPRLPDQFKPADWANPYADFSLAKLHLFLNRYQPTRAPGAKSEYSNLGMGLLGQLLAYQAQSTYEKQLISRITKPLQMTSTRITLDQQQLERLATPHAIGGKPTSNWDLPALAGAGGIRSTANDMLLLAKAHFQPTKNELSKAIDLAWQVHQKPIAVTDSAIGLGWHIASDGSTHWHNGQTGGYHAMMLISRDIKTAVVLLTNTATGEVDQLAQNILRVLAGGKVTPRTFEKSISVPTTIMQSYVGKYQLLPNMNFTVSLKDNKLMIGLTGQPTFEVFARTKTEWFYKVAPATITFKPDENLKKCPALEIFQGGVRRTAKRID